VAGRLSPSLKVNTELFFSTSACPSSNLYGRPDVEFSAQKLLLILTWYDFLRPYSSGPAVSRYGLTGTARVDVGTAGTMDFRILIVVIRSSGNAWMFLFRSGRNYPLPLTASST
jgi:hypothetical protein